MSFTTYEQKPRKLKKLIIDRIDLCDKGANPDARIMLFKRDTSKAEEISVEKFEDMERRIDNLFRDRKDKNMSISEIAKAIEAQKITTRQEAWSAIGKLLDTVIAQELIQASEEQRIARTREQILADLISTSSEGKRLYALYRELPEGRVPKVAKMESIQPASWTKIERLAKALVSEGKAQTIQEAVAQVATAHPDLYREYRREIQ